MFAVACTEEISPSDTTGPTIAFLFDGAVADAELVTSPALSGLELAAHEAGGIEIEPVNVGLELAEVTASLRDLGENRGVLAAVVAPWTAPPPGAIELLADERVPLVTLSWAWGPPAEGDVPWLSFAGGRAREAVILLSGATTSAADPTICLAGDDHVTSLALLETAGELGQAAGDPEVMMVGIAAIGRPETAGEVAGRIRDAGCPSLVWTGGAPAAASVLSRTPESPEVVGTSRMKTEKGLELASTGVAVSTVCGCADVSLSTDPRWQRFVHDLQAESGAPPGPFAVEAYDAGRMLIDLFEGTDGGRQAVASAVDDLTRFVGVAGAYAFEPDGSRTPRRLGIWRASGSRWLPMTPATSPTGASTPA